MSKIVKCLKCSESNEVNIPINKYTNYQLICSGCGVKFKLDIYGNPKKISRLPILLIIASFAFLLLFIVNSIFSYTKKQEITKIIKEPETETVKTKKENFGGWKLLNYVDAFNEPTKSTYARKRAYGTYSNVAVQNKYLEVKIFVDNYSASKVRFELYLRGTRLVSGREEYDVKVKHNNQVYRFTGFQYSSKYFDLYHYDLSKSNRRGANAGEDFIKLLRKGGEFSFVVKESDSGGRLPDEYRFTFNADGFSKIYPKIKKYD